MRRERKPDPQRGALDRARHLGSGPTSGLWAVVFIVVAATAALSWDRGRIAWTGVGLALVLILGIWIWSRRRGWPFLPW